MIDLARDYTVGIFGNYYGDASGGDFSRFTSIRCVGVSVISADASGNLLYGLHCNLPGDVQTVARGELFAAVQSIEEAAECAVINYTIDYYGVYDKYNKGPVAQANSANCDLYKRLYDITVQKAIRLTIRWMPSHLKDDDPLPSGVTRIDVLSNRLADKYAGRLTQ